VDHGAQPALSEPVFERVDAAAAAASRQDDQHRQLRSAVGQVDRLVARPGAVEESVLLVHEFGGDIAPSAVEGRGMGVGLFEFVAPLRLQVDGVGEDQPRCRREFGEQFGDHAVGVGAGPRVDRGDGTQRIVFEIQRFWSGAEVFTQPGDEPRIEREARLYEQPVGGGEGRCAGMTFPGGGLRREDRVLKAADRVEGGRPAEAEDRRDLLGGGAPGAGPRHRQCGGDAVGRDDGVAGRQPPEQFEPERGRSRRGRQPGRRPFGGSRVGDAAADREKTGADQGDDKTPSRPAAITFPGAPARTHLHQSTRSPPKGSADPMPVEPYRRIPTVRLHTG
jgi:hypothetical protein